MKIYLVPVFLTLLFLGCNSTNSSTQDQAGLGETRKQPVIKQTSPAQIKETKKMNDHSEFVRFKKVSVIDRDVMNAEAFSVLIPSDWGYDGRIFWTFDNAAYPANAFFRTASANGDVGYEIFPNQYYYWTNDQMAMMSFPPGSKYMGATVVAPSGDFFTTLQNYVIRYARNQTTELMVKQQRQLPNVAQEYVRSLGSIPGAQLSAQAGVITVEYSHNGKSYEEEFYGIMDFMTFHVQSYTGATLTSVIWKLSNLKSFRAPKGELEKQRRTWEFINQSLRLDLRWYNGMMQVMQMLTNQTMQSIRNAGEISRMISRNNDQILQMTRDSYNAQQQSYERMNNNFSQYIRGVENYTNSSGTTYELPTGYSQVWMNNSNEYILSNDSNFNPNQALSGNWEELNRQP